ncbi:MAG: hypothetical protein DRO05_04910 [Thermoproteota archaeon]|nr:MAG: hypothetical protein DRO05_04910 [Candidatus Korarchaeota archaeon]
MKVDTLTLKKAQDNVKSAITRVKFLPERSRIFMDGSNLLLIPATSVVNTINYIAETAGELAARQMSYKFGKVIRRETAKIFSRGTSSETR